jgi:hypothetical protein
MGNRITKNAALKKAFGVTEEGFLDLPRIISGTQVSRIFAESCGGNVDTAFPMAGNPPTAAERRPIVAGSSIARTSIVRLTWDDVKAVRTRDIRHECFLTSINTKATERPSAGGMMEAHNHVHFGISSGSKGQGSSYPQLPWFSDREVFVDTELDCDFESVPDAFEYRLQNVASHAKLLEDILRVVRRNISEEPASANECFRGISNIQRMLRKDSKNDGANCDAEGEKKEDDAPAAVASGEEDEELTI